jgi:GT2 family glycosyltransferase
MLAWGDIEIFGSFSFVVETADRIDPWYVTYLDEIPPTPMLRRTAIERSGGWTLADTYEDWDFVLRLAELGYAGVRVPGPAVKYRREADRMSADGLRRHGELVDVLRARHPRLFAARRELRPRSAAPLRAKMLFPLVERLPLTPRDRHRLLRLVAHPRQVIRARRARTGAEAG